jgi:glycosyltransferase involved in cell wall biosynthesis
MQRSFFDPENSESILETVRRVAESVSLQTALREKGVRRAGEFSWDRCASEHAKMYASLI